MVGNNDIIYYEPINWVQAGGTANRGGTASFEKAIALADVTSITLNLSFPTGTEGQSTLALVSNAGNLVGLQLQSDNTIKAWTVWTGNSGLNQSGDLDAFTNGETLVTDYTKGTALDVTFVIDKTNKAITVSCGTTTVSLPYTMDAASLTGFKFGQYRNYGAVTVNTVTAQEPDNNYLAISGDADFAKISGQTVTRQYALGQSVIVPDETFAWSVEPADSGVTVDENGLLSVADTATAGKYTITATSNVNAEKTASIAVTVGDFETIDSANVEITGARAYDVTETTGVYKIETAIDSYGDDVAETLPAAVWTSSNTDVATITEDGTLTVVGAGSTTVTATVTNGTAVSKFTVPVTVATYYITADATGNTTAVDTSALVSDSHITGYQVTTSKDGKLVKQEVVASAPTSVDTTDADKLEIAPVYEYAVGAPGTLGNLGAGYDIAIPAGTYNFNVKDTGNRCDVYVNKQMLVNNILQGSSAVNNIDVKDVLVSEGIAKITTADYASGQNESGVNITIKAVKSPSIVDRAKKIYVLGDSLVCVYYNGGNANNNYQTGWGQVLQSYVKDADVVDLGNSGVTASGLYGSAFTQVLTSAKEGDIMILESGYNDKTYDTQDVMRSSVTSMITEAEAKGVKVVLVSPNASVHDYKADVAWTSVMTDIANTTGTDYINLSKLSYEYLNATYGDDTDSILKSYNVSDKLHATYHGAQKWASVIASGLIDLGYGDLVNTDYVYTFTDALGNTITCQAAATAE
jgi:lysophospholipase L1-like esterase